MRDVFVCDAARTAIGRYGGALAKVRTDDLAAAPIRALVARNSRPIGRISTKFFSAAPIRPAKTIVTLHAWRSCWPDYRKGARPDGQSAVRFRAQCGRRCGPSNPRRRDGFRHCRRCRVDDACAVRMGKAGEAFSRKCGIYDTTIGWRFVNPLLKAQYGIDSMPETGENVAEEFQVERKNQDALALRSQQRAGKRMADGYFAEEIVAGEVPGGKAGPVRSTRTSIRPDTTLETWQAQAVRAQSGHHHRR